MALSDSFHLDFVKNVNRQTLTPLNPDRVILSPTYPTEDPSVAQLRLTLKDESQYRGSGVLTYNRLNLADLDRMLATPPYVEPTSNRLYGLLNDLCLASGILLTEEDVYDADLSVTNDGYQAVDLVAKPSSHRWYGEYRLLFEFLPPLSIVLTRQTLLW